VANSWLSAKVPQLNELSMQDAIKMKGDAAQKYPLTTGK